MNESLERVRSTLSTRFPDLEQIGESVLRFERKSSGKTFAVCYVDVSQKIPNTAASLNEYQERIVAKGYFRGRKSLQWSNYLFFLVDNAAKPELRDIVESDRNYARKFVVTEQQLNEALSPPISKLSDSDIKSDILTTWTRILADAGLDTAILSDESMPRRIALIEEQFGQKSIAFSRTTVASSSVREPFLQRIELKQFRPFPKVREFDLGTVTLVSGANGSGKTSILEAIELLYCGQTKRNPNPKDLESYTINAIYSDGKKEIATNGRQLSDFRDRNLAWYGQFEQRTSNLYQMFGRFNFLNADAAVGLSEPKTNDGLEDDLSKLLVGPDASKTWDIIEKTAERLDERIRELSRLQTQVEHELESINRQIAALSELNHESDAILQKLDDSLSSVSWARSEGDITKSVNELVETLSHFAAILREAIKCDWADVPVTIDSLNRFVSEAHNLTESSEILMRKLIDSQKDVRKLAQDLSLIDQKRRRLSDSLKFVESGFFQCLEERNELAAETVNHRHCIAGFDAIAMQPQLESAHGQSIKEFAESAFAKSNEARTKLIEAKFMYKQFNKLREQSSKLAQQLRSIATQILNSESDPDVCPLCHFKHPKGELSKQIQSGLDPRIEAIAAELHAAIAECESDLKNSESRDYTAQWAVQACERYGESTVISAKQLLQMVLESERELESLMQRDKLLATELAMFAKAGITAENYGRFLMNLPPEITSATAEEVKLQCDKLDRRYSGKATEIDTARSSIKSLLNELAEKLNAKDASIESIESKYSEMIERSATSEGILKRLYEFNSTLPSPSSQPLSELSITVETVRGLAGDYQATLSKEQINQSIYAEAIERKNQIETQLGDLTPRIEKLTKARAVLTTIQRDHSLSGAMDEALNQNRSSIEAIFSRIHSPAEFTGLGDKLTFLRRKVDGTTATLQQISTGQRAAFALSLFLAQNAQLRYAPPLILIDDPIAHIDDLNCLSFLDYLRDVVVAGDRQVIFTTANEKLASLFERKFDFLGEGKFIRHNLIR